MARFPLRLSYRQLTSAKNAAEDHGFIVVVSHHHTQQFSGSVAGGDIVIHIWHIVRRLPCKARVEMISASLLRNKGSSNERRIIRSSTVSTIEGHA